MGYFKAILLVVLFVFAVQGAKKSEEKKLEDALNKKQLSDAAVKTKDEKTKDAGVSDPLHYKKRKVCAKYGLSCKQTLKCVGYKKGNCQLVWKCHKNIKVCIKYKSVAHPHPYKNRYDEPAEELNDLNEEDEDEDEEHFSEDELSDIDEENDMEDYDPTYKKCVKAGIRCHPVQQCSHYERYTPYRPRCKFVKKCQQVCVKYARW